MWLPVIRLSDEQRGRERGEKSKVEGKREGGESELRHQKATIVEQGRGARWTEETNETHHSYSFQGET